MDISWSIQDGGFCCHWTWDNVSDVGSLTHAYICELRAVYDNVVAHNPDLSVQLLECSV